MVCPKCQSENVNIKREKQGEYNTKSGKSNSYKTIAFCKNCGYTWDPNYITKTKKNFNYNLLLWILGWIFIFPLPLTLILRKKEMNPIIKYTLIAIAWIVYLVIGFSGITTTAPVTGFIKYLTF